MHSATNYTGFKIGDKVITKKIFPHDGGREGMSVRAIVEFEHQEYVVVDGSGDVFEMWPSEKLMLDDGFTKWSLPVAKAGKLR